MNWGNRLVILFVCFAALIGTLVYKCMHQNFELVSSDYYNQEIRYQDKIDGMNNADKLSPVQITNTAEYLLLQLPREEKWNNASGQLWFYCAGKASNDRKMPLKLNADGLMFIDKKMLATVPYTIKVSWQVAGKPFYTEQQIFLKP